MRPLLHGHLNREEKRTFVGNNPGYGYPHHGTADAEGATAAAVSAPDASGQRRLAIDGIRERDFPSLLQPLAGAEEALPPRQNQQQQQEQGQQEQRQQRPNSNLVYLDHAGATLFGASQLKQAVEPALAGAVHGNPHSQVRFSCVGEVFVRAAYVPGVAWTHRQCGTNLRTLSAAADPRPRQHPTAMLL